MTMTPEQMEERRNVWEKERDERNKALNDAALSLTQAQREAITKVWNLLDDIDTHIRECFDIDMSHARRLTTLEWKLRAAFPDLCRGECTCDD